MRREGNSMMKKMMALVLTAAMITGMTACSKAPEEKKSEPAAQTQTEAREEEKTEAATEPAGEPEKLTISVHPSGHGLPAYIAQEKGWFEEEGLDVETLVYISAPPQMEAYASGAWEIGTTGFGGIILGV